MGTSKELTFDEQLEFYRRYGTSVHHIVNEVIKHALRNLPETSRERRTIFQERWIGGETVIEFGLKTGETFTIRISSTEGGNHNGR